MAQVVLKRFGMKNPAKSRRALDFKKETIRELTRTDLDRVGGQAMATYTSACSTDDTGCCPTSLKCGKVSFGCY